MKMRALTRLFGQFRKFVAEEDIEDIHIIYVVDREDKLKGYIPQESLF